MPQVLRKINNLKNTDTFLQINTVKGFKYIDKAGEIVNLFHKDDIPPQFTMGLDGLVIENPTDKIDTIKIAPQSIWVKSTQIDSLDMVSRIFTSESMKLVDILSIEKINRIGWRNYFVYEFSDLADQKSYFSNLLGITGLETQSVSFKVQVNRLIQANLNVQPVVRENEDGKVGVLFDVDIFQTESIDIDHIQSTLDSYREYINNEENGLVKTLNTTFR